MVKPKTGPLKGTMLVFSLLIVGMLSGKNDASALEDFEIELRERWPSNQYRELHCKCIHGEQIAPHFYHARSIKHSPNYNGHYSLELKIPVEIPDAAGVLVWTLFGNTDIMYAHLHLHFDLSEKPELKKELEEVIRQLSTRDSMLKQAMFINDYLENTNNSRQRAYLEPTRRVVQELVQEKLRWSDWKELALKLTDKKNASETTE